MGGLDARYMISRLGMDRQVLSLTTIGTPHRGTTFADWGVRRLAGLLCPVFRQLHVSTDAFFDLTTEACQRFNERVLHWAFGRPRTVYLGAAGAVVLAAIGLTQAPRSFLPPLNEGLLLVEVGLTPGVSLPESARLGILAEKILEGEPETDDGDEAEEG